ncbi:MAG: acyl-CoA dehydrogenase family protein [Chloroflexi bacterium]|nr:acyl-CoA dehydrogenase family protein [Chloroflexota bacterium]MDA1239239.1 acyl-CoA dehydrogenase family protein [Chloroflexota bacterium]
MDLADTTEQAAFRAQVRDFIAEHGAKAKAEETEGEALLSREVRAKTKGWRDALVASGWIAPAWPVEYGGAGLTATEQFILNEELAESGLSNVGGFGVMMFGPTLMIHGTDDQKREHLGKILRGEVVWCQGWSEPSAGSDLASLQTRAIREGDEYVLNGQKIWTSGAQHSDWMYMLARTDPDAPKHRGISLLMFPMDSSGVSVRPLINLANNHGFNEVFFEDVRVPVANRVGEENRGWYVGMTLTDYERSGIGNAVGTQRRLRGLLRTALDAPPEQTVLGRAGSGWRLAFTDRWIEAEIARLFSYLNITIRARNMVPNHEASMSKLFTSELNQRIAATTLRLYGLYGSMWDSRRSEAQSGKAAGGYLGAVSSTIAGGTSEVQRNIIATRGLGLPRG